MNILFVDFCCPGPYNDASLGKGLGGSEASVVRLSAALETMGHQTVVVQHSRTTSDGRFTGAAPSWKYDHIVVMRDPHMIPMVRATFPNTPVTLWVHDSAVPEAWGTRMSDVPALSPIIVAPSRFQASRLSTAYAYVSDDQRFPIEVIPNPVDVRDALARSFEVEKSDACMTNFNKVLFASDPTRGLVRAIQLVLRARREIRPNLLLHVCRPSYSSPLVIGQILAAMPSARDAVVDLGVLSHEDTLAEMVDSACLFYPNVSVPEAFGLVMAEANGLGVPVITHALGAAPEVVCPTDGQIVSMEPDKIMERLFQLTDPSLPRPLVSLRPEFEPRAVAEQWVSHFRKYAEQRHTDSIGATT